LLIIVETGRTDFRAMGFRAPEREEIFARQAEARA
jgi:hypothetical protein